MSNALTFGIPHKDPLYCANPACREYADVVIHSDDKEVFACNGHLVALTSGKHIKKLERLVRAGERNA